MRGILVRLHRYIGLVGAIFLVLTGVTGSLLAFQFEIDAWLNPSLFEVSAHARVLTPYDLAQRVETVDSRVRVIGLPLKLEPGWSARLSVQPRLDPATGKRYPVGYDQVFVDPGDGRILGTRRARDALMPVIYRFHYTLLDPSGIGRQVLGWVALAWTIDCFIGAYLTLPRQRPFFLKWKPAWQIKRRANAFRLNLDLHRAGGLWLWAVLFVVALSSVYYNLQREIFKPAVELVSPVTESIFDIRGADGGRAARQEFPLPFAAVDTLARAEAARRHWQAEPGMIFHYAAYGFHAVRFWPTQYDRGSGLGAPILFFDDQDGRLVSAEVPGEGTAGDLIMQLQYPLHSGRIAGLPGRIAVCVGGVVVSVLSITGVVIWWKKRRSRNVHRLRRSLRRINKGDVHA